MILDKNKLQLQIKFMKNKSINFSHTDYQIIDRNDNILGKMKIQKNCSIKIY